MVRLSFDTQRLLQVGRLWSSEQQGRRMYVGSSLMPPASWVCHLSVLTSGESFKSRDEYLSDSAISTNDAVSWVRRYGIEMATQIGQWTLTPFRYWRTADGRFLFQPRAEGWIVIATTGADQQLLAEADISAHVQMNTLKDWVQLCHQHFGSSAHLRRQNQAYTVEQTPLTLRRQHRQRWGFARSIVRHSLSAGQSMYQGNDTSWSHDEILAWERVLSVMRGCYFLTRAEALQSLAIVVAAEPLLSVGTQAEAMSR